MTFYNFNDIYKYSIVSSVLKLKTLNQRPLQHEIDFAIDQREWRIYTIFIQLEFYYKFAAPRYSLTCFNEIEVLHDF